MKWTWLNLKEKYEWLDSCVELHNAKDIDFWCDDEIKFIVEEWRKQILLDRWFGLLEGNKESGWLNYEYWKEAWGNIDNKKAFDLLYLSVVYRNHVGLHLNSMVEDWIKTMFPYTKDTIPVESELITIDFVGSFRGCINWERRL